ncbi:condensation domain-containing protein [Bradyrhizobium sp. WSM471]|uniref:condensation domain-containing protein n=1 Tax=Bradyrhizobium sp. WSM471 TaxID=319017 RepID=UPI00024D2354|nr:MULTISPECIES: condensation domain-containing protein [Bradyrhizobium]EHR00838.1 non-ribosomal peptide synthase [Bradyrhizobium sp. WSM471]UFW42917.1 condensation domain-containing protein [Bradyrhizobium canariense]
MKVFGVIQIDAAAGIQSGALPGISAVPRRASVPLSLRQQQFWFVSRLKGGSEDCHVQTMLRLRGQLDKAVLQSALDGLVAHHELLRTTFAAQDGEPFQKVGRARTGLLLRRDHLTWAVDLEAALSELVRREVEVPFDLELGPLIRARLVRLAVDDHALAITMHHMVSDTWSRNILTRDLSEFYNAIRENCAVRFKVSPVQYADYALWQHRWLSGQALQRQSEYSHRILVGAPAVLELPTDRPRSSRPDYYGGDVEFTLHPVLTDQIKALSRNLNTSLFVMLLSASVLVLARLSCRDELVIGTPGANRAYSEIRLIGLFMNPLALRIDLSSDPTLEILVERGQAAAVGAKAHQDLPSDQMLKLVNSSRTLAHSPIFQGAFACENNVVGPAQLGGLKLECVNPCVRFEQHDLALDVNEVNAECRGRLFYATALLERSTIDRFADNFHQAVSQMDRGFRTRSLVVAEMSRSLECVECERSRSARSMYPGANRRTAQPGGNHD